MATNPPSSLAKRPILSSLYAFLFAPLLLLSFLLVESVNGNAVATRYLTGLLTWLTGGAWPAIAAVVFALLVPSPLARVIEQALAGNTKPLAAEVTPVINQELKAVNIPLQVDASQAEVALNHVLSGLLDAHSSTDSLTAKLADAADKAAQASILSFPATQPVTATVVSASNPPIPLTSAADVAPAGPLSVPAPASA